MTNDTETLSADTTGAPAPTTTTTPVSGVPSSTTAPVADTPPTTTPPVSGAAYDLPPTPVTPSVPQYYGPVQRKTNVLGIITLVLGVLGFGVVPVITGHIALGQIKKSGEDGRGLTLAGLVLGYVTLAGWLAVALFWIAFAGVAVFGSILSTY